MSPRSMNGLHERKCSIPINTHTHTHTHVNYITYVVPVDINKNLIIIITGNYCVKGCPYHYAIAKGGGFLHSNMRDYCGEDWWTMPDDRRVVRGKRRRMRSHTPCCSSNCMALTPLRRVQRYLLTHGLAFRFDHSAGE